VASSRVNQELSRVEWLFKSLVTPTRRNPPANLNSNPNPKHCPITDALMWGLLSEGAALQIANSLLPAAFFRHSSFDIFIKNAESANGLQSGDQQCLRHKGHILCMPLVKRPLLLILHLHWKKYYQLDLQILIKNQGYKVENLFKMESRLKY